MNKKAIAYTLIKNFNNYEKIIDNIDREVNTKATKSHTITYSLGIGYQTVENLTQNIIDLIEQKRYIISCRIMVLEAMATLTEREAQVLKNKFFYKKTFKEIGEEFGYAPTQARREVIKHFRTFYNRVVLNPEFETICESKFCFYKPLNLDYLQSSQNERLMKMGLI